MIRLSNAGGYYYNLKNTETQEYLGRCAVVPHQKILEIWSVHIYEEFQRKGFATLMLKRIIKKFRNDKRPLRLYVYKDNEVAIHLYKKLGFEIIGEYERTTNAWTMQYKGKN